jgi:hypothetical protein
MQILRDIFGNLKGMFTFALELYMGKSCTTSSLGISPGPDRSKDTQVVAVRYR